MVSRVFSCFCSLLGRATGLPLFQGCWSPPPLLPLWPVMPTLGSWPPSPYSSTSSTKWPPSSPSRRRVLRLMPTCVSLPFLLEEEHASVAALEAETTSTTLQLVLTTTSPSALSPPPSEGDAAVVTTLHAQVIGVQNILSLVLTVLDPSSTGYTHDAIKFCSP
jgi:hypothetical protein